MYQKGKQLLAYLSKPEIWHDWKRGERFACYSKSDMLDFTVESELYQCFVHSDDAHKQQLLQMDEKIYQTGLREIIGLLKRCDRKEALRQYCRSNRRRLSGLDEDTFLIAGILLGEPKILIGRERFKKEGKYDMCKALRELLQESEKRGVTRGTKLGEQIGRKKLIKELVRKLHQKGKSIDEISEWMDIPKREVVVHLHHHEV